MKLLEEMNYVLLKRIEKRFLNVQEWQEGQFYSPCNTCHGLLFLPVQQRVRAQLPCLVDLENAPPPPPIALALAISLQILFCSSDSFSSFSSLGSPLEHFCFEFLSNLPHSL